MGGSRPRERTFQTNCDSAADYASGSHWESVRASYWLKRDRKVADVCFRRAQQYADRLSEIENERREVN